MIGTSPFVRPHLLVIGTGMRAYRDYLLRSIATSFDVHLFAHHEPSWEREYVTDWTVLPSTLDGPLMARAAAELSARRPVAGVLCWDEGRIHAAAQVAQALGLPGGDPEAVLRCRDKHLSRLALAAEGVPQPASALVRTVEEALAFAEGVGYPAILKPRGLAASAGVVRVDDAAQLASQFPFTKETVLPEAPLFDSILVEEFATGPEISVDSAVQGGRVQPMFLAQKVIGFPPYCEELGHFVDGADPTLGDPQLAAILQNAHAALGFTNGMTHTEFKLTPTGPKVIEVNGRLGGDLIPYLGALTTGIDPGLVAAQVACGQRVSLTADRGLVGGVRFFYVDRDDTTVGSVGFVTDRLPPAVRHAVALVEPGTTVSPPPKGTLFGRIALSVAVADTREACEEALTAAQDALSVTLA